MMKPWFKVEVGRMPSMKCHNEKVPDVCTTEYKQATVGFLINFLVEIFKNIPYQYLKKNSILGNAPLSTVISVIMQRPNFYRKYATPIFDSSFFANSDLGDAWLKALLVLQHIPYHHPKN